MREAGDGSAAPAQRNEVLDELALEDLRRVVAAATPRVKTYCWQPWLDSRAPGAKTKARIVFRVEIDRSGKVTDVATTESTDGFSVLAACVATLVRDFTFPRASTTTTVNIPFVFDAREP